MTASPTTAERPQTAQPSHGLAKALAPEDVRVGDCVAVLHEVCEFASFMWCFDSTLAPQDQLVRIKFMPWKGGEPLEVSAVCLPFVLAKPVRGKVRMIDVRRYRLARLDPAFAAVWKEATAKRKKTK